MDNDFITETRAEEDVKKAITMVQVLLHVRTDIEELSRAAGLAIDTAIAILHERYGR